MEHTPEQFVDQDFQFSDDQQIIEGYGQEANYGQE